MRWQQKVWVVVGLLAAGWWAAGRVNADAPEPVQSFPTVTYAFGKQIHFRVRFRPAGQVQRAEVFYRPAWLQGNTLFADLTPTEKGDWTFDHDLQRVPFPPFVTIYYWFHLVLNDGSDYTTPSFSFVLQDNRFKWQHFSAPPFRVWWYRGDARMAQRVVDAGSEGLSRVRALWLAPPPSQVDIYVYADPQALQTALGSEGWVAGHASPAFGALFVLLPPGPQQQGEIRRLVPHELAHAILYRQLGAAGYRSLPAWLNEGLASNCELDPNPDYRQILDDAVRQHRLIPIVDLCTGFPADTSGALLAYAESASFVDYLLHRYGRSAMQTLVLAYGQGIDCKEGVPQVLGTSLPRLDRAWQRKALRTGSWWETLMPFWPWLALAGAMLFSLWLGWRLQRQP